MQLKFTGTLICAIALACGAYLQFYGFNLPPQNSAKNIEGFFWPAQKKLVDFELIDQNRQPFKLKDLLTGWHLLFFGYTHCPDICPMTMNAMREVRQLLQLNVDADANDIRFAFISVDGERDTPEHLKGYIEYFSEDFIGASGNTDQIASLAGQLGVAYSIDDHEPGDVDYLVGHSGALFLISPIGKLAAIFHTPHNPDEITRRLIEIQTFTDRNS